MFTSVVHEKGEMDGVRHIGRQYLSVARLLPNSYFASIIMEGTDAHTTPTAMVMYVFTGSFNETHGC